MQVKLGYLIPILGAAAATAGIATAAEIVTAAPAAADCNYSGGSTLCSSTGEVRGGSAPAQSYSPYPCSYGDPMCAYYDDWDPQIYLDLGRPGIGGPGGIGPRR
jgi:hypothetical protein